MKKTLMACLLVAAAGLAFWGLSDNAAEATAKDRIRLIVNGQEIQADVPPMIVNGRTMVPVRFVSEALGAVVNWDEATQTVTISTALAEVTPSYLTTVNEEYSQAVGLLDAVKVLVSDPRPGDATWEKAAAFLPKQAEELAAEAKSLTPAAGLEGFHREHVAYLEALQKAIKLDLQGAKEGNPEIIQQAADQYSKAAAHGKAAQDLLPE